MRWTFTRGRVLILITLALGVACVLLLTVGSIRYGGPGELLLRVRVEIAARRPHPQFVPTPLPTPTPALVAAISGDETEPGAVPFLSNSQPATEEAPSPAPIRVSPATSTPSPTSARLSHLSTIEHPVNQDVIGRHKRHGPRNEPVDSALTGHESSPPPTATPTPTPTVIPSPTPPPTPARRPAEKRVELSGFTHMWQKWNNCGPATLAMNLSYFGSLLSQQEVAAVLKPNWDDKNVSPEEMADFARSQGFQALVRVNGDVDRLRLLLSNGVPTLIETWLELEPGNGMGHYRLLTGYDDGSQEFIVFDSYVSAGVDASQPYQGIRMPYDEVDRLWSVFNRTYVLIYTEDLAPVALSIIGEQTDDATMWQQALRQAQAVVRERPDDPFAWFNLGTDLVALGQFEEAGVAYDRARVIGLPWRMLWYQFGPFRAYYETGRYEELITLAEATIVTAGNIEEVYYWKGLGLAAQDDATGARQAWQRAVELNPNYVEAVAALSAMGESPSEGAQPGPTPDKTGG